MKNLLNLNTVTPTAQMQQPSAPQESTQVDPNQSQVNPLMRTSINNLTNPNKPAVFGAAFK